MEWVLPVKKNKALILNTNKILEVRLCKNVDGISKLNRKRYANNKETAQMLKSILNIIHEGVVD